MKLLNKKTMAMVGAVLEMTYRSSVLVVFFSNLTFKSPLKRFIISFLTVSASVSSFGSALLLLRLA